MSTPMTTISVCSDVFIDNSYRHTLYFRGGVDEQEEYFRSKTVRQFTGYSYCRHTWSIKVEAHINEARYWKYLYFVNAPDIKPYYYFITRVEYINDSTVELFLEMDVMQTYLCGENLKPCFIERQTARYDEIGGNTVDEGLELGELTVNAQSEFDELEDCCVLIMATEYLKEDGTTYAEYGWNINGVPIGVGIYATTVDRIQEVLAEYGGNSEAIMSVWLYPKRLVKLDNDVSWDTVRLIKVKKLDAPEYHFNVPTQIKGYTPVNKKLFTYPYNFLYVTNNLGTSANYRYERFDARDTFFEVVGSPFPDGGAKLVPRNYNGVGFNHDEGLTLSSYPTCAFSSDFYKIWLAQNQNTRDLAYAGAAVTVLGGAGTAVASAAMSNPMGAVAGVGAAFGGFAQIFSQFAKERDMQAQPAQARGAQSASINAVNGKHTFTFYAKCITSERAKMIDDFFTMYGYKLNRIAVPDLYARKRFTYVKTVGCLAADYIPVEAKQKIEQIYDNGITLWADHENAGRYDLPNLLHE